MLVSYPIIRVIMVLWTSLFVAVASVPRCDAIADLIDMFRSQHVTAELSCHKPTDEQRLPAAATRLEQPLPCPCITLDFTDFFQSTSFNPKLQVLMILQAPEVTVFINRFWQYFSPLIGTPPPRFV